MNDVKKIIRSSIEKLLELGVNFRLHRYLFDRHAADWRDLSVELHVNYPVRSLGIIATPMNIEKYHFLHGDEPVSPDEIVGMVGDPVYDAAMASYAFTIVEMCGDEVAALVKQMPPKQRAWHTDIKQNKNLSACDADKQRAKFVKPFDGNIERLTATSVIRLARMKAVRNEFAHQGNPMVDFNQFLEDALAVLSQIYFLCVPGETHLKVYPWDDLTDKWEEGNFEHTQEPD
jgi:hypothetical protein